MIWTEWHEDVVPYKLLAGVLLKDAGEVSVGRVIDDYPCGKIMYTVSRGRFVAKFLEDEKCPTCRRMMPGDPRSLSIKGEDK